MSFGPPPISPDKIVAVISERVYPLLPKHHSGPQQCRRALTDALYTGLRSLTDESQFYVRHKANGLKRNDPNRELMWDHVWVSKQDAQLALVLESEWSKWEGLVVDDFKKLLYAKAPLKVLVYVEQKENLKVPTAVEECLKSFPFHFVGEQYLIVNARGWRSGHVEACLYEILSDPFGLKIAGPLPVRS